MEQFKVFRAIGLGFKAWFANFIPLTLLALILYGPAAYWLLGVPASSSGLDGLQSYLNRIQYGVWLLEGCATLIPPLITYRVIQYMNGQRASMLTSIKFGMRGIIPAFIVGIVGTLLGLVPFGFILAIILQCYWFVAAPSAVVEQLNPIAALSRSSVLTQGRRWPIFGLSLLVGLIVGVMMAVFIVPAVSSKSFDSIKSMMIAILVLGGVSRLFMGTVQAVSYSLLRADKDGVSNEELAKVFE